MQSNGPQASGTAASHLSLEMEHPAAAIKRFALLDSSDDELDVAGGSAPAAAEKNRFDRSKLDWSRLLDDSSDAAPTPPLRPRAAFSAVPQATDDSAATAAPAARTSSFRRLAMTDSDGSVNGGTPATTPPPSQPVRSRPTTAMSRQRRTAEKVSRVRAPASLIPQALSDASPTATMEESVGAARTPASSHLEHEAAQPATRHESPAAPVAAADSSLLPTAAPLKPRTALKRPAALQNFKSLEDTKRTDSAAPAPPPAAEAPQPLSPGMVYSTVPQWTKGMRKKHGKYVAAATVAANPTGLYERGLKQLQRAEERREALRAKLEEAERSAATFHPAISPRAHALRRSGRRGGGDAAEQEMSNQLRHRLQLLELPEEAAATCRHSPRISATSEKIVRECRERSGAVSAPSERLYHDFFYRQQALEAAQAPPPASALVRTQRDIDAHVAALYEYEEHRRHAIATARDAPLLVSPRAPQAVYVDAEDVVKRLTGHRAPSRRRVVEALAVADECTFKPRANANATALVQVARQRGLQRWVTFFGGSSALTVSALLDHTGPAHREAQSLVAFLSQCDPAKVEWTAAELASSLDESENTTLGQLWRLRPPNENGDAHFSELTFHPALNGTSAAIVESMEAEQRCGPTHDRLFLAAKSKQLSKRQEELEAEQAALEAEQRAQAKKERQRAEWRAKEQHRLEAYREEKARQDREARLLQEQEAAVPPPPSTSAQTRQKGVPTSRRLELLQPSLSPESAVRRRSQPSPSPARAVRAASYATSLPKPEVAVVVAAPEIAPSPPTASTPAVSTPPSTIHAAAACGDGLTEVPASASFCADAGQREAKAPMRRDSRELSSAAETLRQLLGKGKRPSAGQSCSQTTTTATDATVRVHASSTPITSRDINRPREDKPDSCSLDVVLRCATLRDLSTVAQSERGELERAQKRQLRELGRLLYNRNKARVEDR